jgi:hypothetical protein
VLRAFAIVVMAALHDRMSAMLEHQGDPICREEVKGDRAVLLRPAGDDALKVWDPSRG